MPKTLRQWAEEASSSALEDLFNDLRKGTDSWDIINGEMCERDYLKRSGGSEKKDEDWTPSA